jgi:hypothetical protein
MLMKLRRWLADEACEFCAVACSSAVCCGIERVCPNEGCGRQLCKHDLPEHIAECSYRILPCPLRGSGCSEHFRAGECLEAHSLVCPFRKTGCKFPGCAMRDLSARDTELHTLTCEFRPIACGFRNCVSVFQWKDVRMHRGK